MWRRERILRFFLRLGCCVDDAEDLTQQVQVKLWVATQRGVEVNSAYCSRTCKSVWSDFISRKRCEQQWVTSLQDCPEPCHLCPTDMRYAEIMEIISALSEEQQDLIYLRAVEGRSFVEIAHHMGCKPSTVRMRYHRIIARIKEHFITQDKRGGGNAILFAVILHQPCAFSVRPTVYYHGRRWEQ